MTGRTVSHDVAESVALEARREERSPGQIAALALRFFMTLPRDARALHGRAGQSGHSG